MPCLALAAWDAYIIGGFANGQLRLYDSQTGLKLIEVAAHGRPVMALDVAPLAGMVSECVCIHANLFSSLGTVWANKK